MLFLPASFSTSIFGMASILPSFVSIRTFAVVVGVVCGATYLVIVVFEFRAWRKRKRESMPADVESASGGTEEIGGSPQKSTEQSDAGDVKKG